MKQFRSLLGQRLLYGIIVAVIWLLPVMASAKKVVVTVYDCADHQPVANVQIYNSAQEYLGTTDRKGKASLTILNAGNIIFTKLGYEDKVVPSLAERREICLEKEVTTMEAFSVTAVRPDYFDTLTRLRNQNRKSFLDFDARLTYFFSYAATDLRDGSRIDTAAGYFTVAYQGGYAYPNLFANSNKFERVIDFYYRYDSTIPAVYFSRLNYLHASNLLCCYDMMEQKFNQPNWWNYLGMEAPEQTKVFQRPDGGRIFATYTKEGKLSKRFYFDRSDILEKIEIYRPMFFYQGNFDDWNCKFLVTVHYTKKYPRTASRLEYSYEVDSIQMPYKVKMHIDLTNPKQQKIKVRDDRKKHVVLSLVGSFHEIYLSLKEAVDKGWIIME